MTFTGKVVLVTGGSSGIGAAIAVKFAAHGANVAIVGRNQTKLNKVKEECEHHGKKHLIITADVSKDADLQRVLTETIARYGKLNVLVNNAGISVYTSILSEDAIGLFDKVMSTNLRPAVYLTNIAARHLIETKGNVINISSIAAMSPLAKGNFAYGASKAAMDHFSRCIALELAPQGVRVNTVNPGPVKTDIIENMGASESLQDSTWEKMKTATSLNRISDPEEIADLVLFLASDKAKSITGSSYVTDNGFLLKGTVE